MSYSYRSIKKSSVASRYQRNNRSQRTSNRGGRREYIDPSRYIKAATFAEAEVYVPQHTFADFAIEAGLKANLASKGYITPSPIQDQTIPAALEGKDIIGIANTGTGKTAAFAIPVIQRLVTGRAKAALVIAPTRELAQQIEEECKTLGKGSGLFSALLIGGSNMQHQLRDLKQQPKMVIGTPGRIKDHLDRGTLKLASFDIVVLDEVDRMLDMGFVDAVKDILKQASPVRQSFFFSATIESKVRSLIDNFTHDPFTVSLKASSTSENVHQDVIRYAGNTDRLNKLHDILLKADVAKVLVFDETQRNVERLHKELQTRGFSTDAIHGGKSQSQRQRALSKFKKDEVNILVATDVAARGIDVADITHVINYSVPKVYDDYIHRIGRTGRAGQIGYALTFVEN